jgi:hypothetical protein
MTVGRYVLTFVAIIIGLGVANLLTSLHQLLRAANRVKWDWLALSFTTLMLFVSVLFWWFSIRWYQDVTSATIASFLPKLAFLIVAFLMMAACLPDEVPEEGVDLRRFYLESRVHLWSLVTISLVMIVVINIIDRGMAWFDISIMWGQILSIVLAAAAIFFRHVWVHALAIAWLFYWTLRWNLFAQIGN